MKPDNVHELSQLLGGYFHQDFLHEFADEEAALTAIVDSEDRLTLQTACRQIDAILDAGFDEPELCEFLGTKLQCSFLPSSCGVSCSTWLVHVKQRLQTHLAARREIK
jgi:hypothetical protein